MSSQKFTRQDFQYAITTHVLSSCYHLRKQVRKLSTSCAPDEYPLYGSLCWKVSDISCRENDLEHPAIVSRSFWSAPNGYKMHLKLKFESEANELQVMILEGINDDSLAFPFREQIEVGILSFGVRDGLYKEFSDCHAARCFSECEGSIAASLSVPRLSGSHLVHGDDVYIKCVAQEKRIMN